MAPGREHSSRFGPQGHSGPPLLRLAPRRRTPRPGTRPAMPRLARPHAAFAWLNVIARLGGTALSFALYLALARLLDPRGFADVAVALAWINVGAALCSVSLPLALVRFVPEQLAAGRPDLARGAVQYSIALTVGIAVAT